MRSRRSPTHSRACSKRPLSSLSGHGAGAEAGGASPATAAAARASGRSVSSSARPSASTARTSGRRSRSGCPSSSSTLSPWSNSSGSGRLGLLLAAAVLISLSYVGAVALVTGAPLRSRSALLAYAIGVLVFLPFPAARHDLRASGPRLARAPRPLGARGTPRAHSELALRSSAGTDSREWTTCTCSAVSRRSHSSSSSRSSACTSCCASSRRTRARARRHFASLRRLAARLPRQRDPLRRPGGSVTLARPANEGVRCRPTSC